MIDASHSMEPVLVDIDFDRDAHRASVGPRPVLHKPSGRMRSPVMARAPEASIPRGEPIPIEMPSIRAVVGLLAWSLVPALPMLARVGWQQALVTAVVALLARETRLRANGASFSFGEGFLGYVARDGWPRGVQEDDDVRWNWSTVRPG